MQQSCYNVLFISLTILIISREKQEIFIYKHFIELSTQTQDNKIKLRFI